MVGDNWARDVISASSALWIASGSTCARPDPANRSDYSSGGLRSCNRLVLFAVSRQRPSTHGLEGRYFRAEDAQARTLRLPGSESEGCSSRTGGFESNAADNRPGSERRFDCVQFENRQIGTLGRRKPALGQDFLKLIT